MDNFDRDLDDLLNMTDSDEDASTDSSNGGIFESDPVVLELHELKKDEPSTGPTTETQEPKKTREKRKKKKPQSDAKNNEANDSSSSFSDSIQNVPDESNKEEFYDAHESYHELPENQEASPTAALVLAQVHSEHVEDPKIILDRRTSERPSATPREPSTINKPVSNPPP